jgi:hypothetical protein
MIVFSFLAAAVYLIYNHYHSRFFGFGLLLSLAALVCLPTSIAVRYYVESDMNSTAFYTSIMIGCGLISGFFIFLYAEKLYIDEKPYHFPPLPQGKFMLLGLFGLSCSIFLSFLLAGQYASCESVRCKKVGSIMGTDVKLGVLYISLLMATIMNQVIAARLFAIFTNKIGNKT